MNNLSNKLNSLTVESIIGALFVGLLIIVDKTVACRKVSLAV